MLLGVIPSDIATKEALLVWLVGEIRREVVQANPSAQYPQKVTEAQGFFPSDVVSIQEISSVDGGPRHVLRVLMPVNPAYYGSTSPVYQFAGLLQP